MENSKDVIIIGAGNSVQEGLNLNLWNEIRTKEVWSLNSVYKVMPFLPVIQLWVDTDFFKHDVEDLQKLHEKGVKLVAKEHIKLAGLSDKIELWKTTRVADQYYGKEAIAKNLLYVGRMGLSGMFGLSYAVALQYERIFLLGYDFGVPDKKSKETHWYQQQITEKNIYSTGAGRPEVYLQSGGKTNVSPYIEDFAVYLKNSNSKIYNVSLNSHIPYFDKISYSDFFKMIGETNATQ